jgi:hypothetical protein
MSPEYHIWTRLITLFCTLLSLAAASLSLTNAYFAATLRDRVRSNYTTTGVLDKAFQRLLKNVLIGELATAILTIACAIYGFVIAVHPRWLKEYRWTLEIYGCLQFLLAILMIGAGALLATQVKGFQTSFQWFGANASIPYYSTMYYGSVAQVAYGVVIVITLVSHNVARPKNGLFWRAGDP